MTPGGTFGLSAATLIDLGDMAARQSLAQWSVSLLAAGFPAIPVEQILALPLGQRDRMVMQIRAALIGDSIASEPQCSACGATYALTLRAEDIGLGPGAAAPDPNPVQVQLEGAALSLRPVTLADVLAVDSIADPQDAAAFLCERAGGAAARQIGAAHLAPVLEALDPAADVWIATRCPECGAAQDLAFDPVHFTACEIGYLSRQLLQDVADIARVFHWSEADILALPDQRRAFYLREAFG